MTESGMEFGDTPEEAAFRAEARDWLAANAPRPGTPEYFIDLAHSREPADQQEYVHRARAWQGTMAAAGWACLTWPTEFGGRGASPIEAQIFEEESAAFGVGVTRGMFMAAISMAGHTLIAHGTEAQQRRFLEPIRTGELIWTQLFSEPGAGSDLGSVRTRAERDGDEYVVNGQKVWNSYAHVADWGILLTRSDPTLPKHRGLTYLLLDMTTPGVEVRPLRQMTGASEFNETFFTDVRVPAGCRVGDENDGWRVALTTLNSERGAVGALSAYLSVDDVVALARAVGLDRDPTIRQRLAEAWIRGEVLRYLRMKAQTALSHGRPPGPEASIMKLVYGNHLGETSGLAVDILGAAGMLNDPDGDHRWQQACLGQFGTKIGGGTAEIQRNTIGERVLGLPREPRVDKDVPFNQLPTG